MRRFILGILFVVIASHPIQAYYQREYRDEYTRGKVFIRVLANLTQVPDDIPDEAVEVNLRYNMITDIPINAFSNLRVCKSLRLAHNEISVIESGSFNGLNSLTELWLSDNEISVIESGMFNGLNSLTILVLGINMIRDIPINVFSNLQNFRVLILEFNEISVIEAGMFNGLNSLTEVNLSFNNISALPEGTFTSLSSLKGINLNGNNIQTVSANMFPSNVEILKFGGNGITALKDVAYSNLVFLKELTLIFNSISTIPANAFSTLSNCEFLYLHNNPIENIEVGAFHGLRSLEFLSLRNNKLTTLDPLVLAPLPRPLTFAMDTRYTPSSMVCDIKLCWLKVEEKAGSIIWERNQYISPLYRGNPNCTGGVDWQSLQCPETIPCSDPGQVEGAERSRSLVPFNNNAQPELGLHYSSDSEFTYTCGPCYTGGNITCQSGQWTRKPECTRSDNREVCIAPGLPNGYLTPSSKQYECGVTVTFTCDEGFTLSGPSDGTCGPDGQFVGETHSCKNNSSSRIIYGIVGVVCGIILMGLIGITLFYVKRLKKGNRSEANTTVGNQASEAGNLGRVTGDQNGKQGNNLYTAEPTADRGTQEQRVTGDGTVYNNTAYEDE